MYFEIQADEPQRAIEFYSTVFGWNFTEVPGLPIPYWLIRTAPDRAGEHEPHIHGQGGLLKRPAKTPPPQCGTNAFVCSFEVKSFDQTAERILKLGGIVALAKFPVPGKCWQGYFLDTEANAFGIFEVDETAGR
jgi:predicted enzyme related to lactoylglutathione lyase